jgi:hypothetical protein
MRGLYRIVRSIDLVFIAGGLTVLCMTYLAFEGGRTISSARQLKITAQLEKSDVDRKFVNSVNAAFVEHGNSSSFTSIKDTAPAVAALDPAH